jgi:hypothetical protein
MLPIAKSKTHPACGYGAATKLLLPLCVPAVLKWFLLHLIPTKSIAVNTTRLSLNT